MKPSFRLVTFALASLLAPAALAQTAPSGQSPIKVYDAAQQQRMAWFTHARFGMFIHWGLYSIPAGQWPGRTSTSRAEWIMLQENLPSSDYEKLAPQFNPVKFDAHAWVDVAKAAGMKYLVVTSRHHDGFSMFATKQTPYNMVDATPFGRDPIKELADACHEAGIVFCVYYSIADWHHPDSPAEYSQRARDPKTDKQDPDRGFHGNPNPKADVHKYDAFMRAQVRELLTRYGEIGIVWFDGGGAFRVSNRGELIEADQMADLIHSLQPACLINNRLGVAADYGTPEQRIPGGKTVEPFEVCMTINGHWGYNRFDDKWKSAETIVRNIADIVSKGGNYLLNVGPMSTGEFPPESIRILREVGQWTHANADAIYGAGPTPFGDELGYEDPVKKDRDGKPAWVDRNEWRCTTQPGNLYFSLLHWPGEKFTLPAFPNKIVRAYLLADPMQHPLAVTPDASGATVILPPAAPAGLAPVLCVEIEGAVVPRVRGEKLDGKKDSAS